MAEREIREIIRSLCERLDRTVMRPVVKAAVPMAVGAGIAISGGCATGTSEPLYMAPDAVVDQGPSNDPGLQPAYMAPDNGAVTIYSAPLDVALTDEAAVDPGAQPPYMAPDDGVQPLYMGPDDVVEPVDPGVQPPYMAPDNGDQPLYMGPDDAVEPVDPGVQPPYMAPDNGLQPLYAADFDAGVADAAIDPGNVNAYMAPMYGAPSPAPAEAD